MAAQAGLGAGVRGRRGHDRGLAPVAAQGASNSRPTERPARHWEVDADLSLAQARFRDDNRRVTAFRVPWERAGNGGRDLECGARTAGARLRYFGAMPLVDNSVRGQGSTLANAPGLCHRQDGRAVTGCSTCSTATMTSSTPMLAAAGVTVCRWRDGQYLHVHPSTPPYRSRAEAAFSEPGARSGPVGRVGPLQLWIRPAMAMLAPWPAVTVFSTCARPSRTFG